MTQRTVSLRSMNNFLSTILAVLMEYQVTSYTGDRIAGNHMWQLLMEVRAAVWQLREAITAGLWSAGQVFSNLSPLGFNDMVLGGIFKTGFNLNR